MPRISDLTPALLLSRWREIVNQNTQQRRDIYLLEKFLQGSSAVQMVLGMYQYESNRTISIPIFLKAEEEWMEWNEEVAKIELACYLSKTTPAQYYVWKDLAGEENARSHGQMHEAYNYLVSWANRIVL